MILLLRVQKPYGQSHRADRRIVGFAKNRSEASGRYSKATAQSEPTTYQERSIGLCWERMHEAALER